MKLWYSLHSSFLRLMGAVPREIEDPTGVWLTPGKPNRCKGHHPERGIEPFYEDCCDECEYYLLCFPDWWKAIYPSYWAYRRSRPRRPKRRKR